MLLAEFFLAIAPAADRNAGGDALVHAGRINSHRGAETESHYADAIGAHFRTACKKRQRAAGILDLLQTNHPPAHALAVAATAHIKAQRDIAELLEQPRGHLGNTAVFVAAKAVQHHHRGAGLARNKTVGNMQNAGELELAGRKPHALFHVILLCRPVREAPAGSLCAGVRLYYQAVSLINHIGLTGRAKYSPRRASCCRTDPARWLRIRAHAIIASA